MATPVKRKKSAEVRASAGKMRTHHGPTKGDALEAAALLDEFAVRLEHEESMLEGFSKDTLDYFTTLTTPTSKAAK